MPLLDVIRDMGGFFLVEGPQNFYADIITNQQLEVVEED
jgi:hypothetical protein